MKEQYCGECGKSMVNETVYTDEHYECLCKDCLLMLHEKRGDE